ncbi:MAG: coproporphyrinogen III oxidase family protein [Deltaproteobacteria bacterium]|nr:coproporphyrinogen III oxidase family protein [Deltaproteobacteria bacterium]
MSLIDTLITRSARQMFGRAMRFDGKNPARIPAGSSAKPRLLYLHVPFCERLCPYCSFNRVVFDAGLCREYFQALRKEIVLYKNEGHEFSGIYVGGGTPTILINELQETLSLARQCFGIREISVETNPNHLTEENLEILKSSGVSRLSVGIQSFDGGLLKDMDRYDKYGSGAVIAAQLERARGYFDTLNADMIFNFPSQTMATLNNDLDILTGMGMDQITYYPLMVSDSTREKVVKTLGRVDYGKEKKLYRRIVERLAPSYRFSSAWCFSRKSAPIDEYIVDYDEYAGLGSGAIGYINGICYANTFDIPEYIERAGRGEMPLFAAREFSFRDKVRYDFLMKLFGMKLDLEAMKEKYGSELMGVLWPDILVFSLIRAIRYWPPHLHLTEKGRYVWVILMREFFIAVNNLRDYCRARIPSA